MRSRKSRTHGIALSSTRIHAGRVKVYARCTPLQPVRSAGKYSCDAEGSDGVLTHVVRPARISVWHGRRRREDSREGGEEKGTHQEPRPFTLLRVTGTLQAEIPPDKGVRDLDGDGDGELDVGDDEEKDGPGHSTCLRS